MTLTVQADHSFRETVLTHRRLRRAKWIKVPGRIGFDPKIVEEIQQLDIKLADDTIRLGITLAEVHETLPYEIRKRYLQHIIKAGVDHPDFARAKVLFEQMSNWDSKSYWGMRNWAKYYQNVAQQYYDAWKAGRTDMDHQGNYLADSSKARAIVEELVTRYDWQTGQVRPSVLKAEQRARDRAAIAKEVRMSYMAGVFQRKIGNLYRAMKSENATSEDLERYRDEVAQDLIRAHGGKDMPCYKSDPLLWEMFIERFGKASRPYSQSEVKERMATLTT